MKMAELVELGWLVTGIGWIVSFFSEKSINKRKEKISEVENIISIINETVEYAIDYYSEKDKNELTIKTLYVTMLLERLRSSLESYRVNTKKSLDLYHARFYESMTDGNFGSPSMVGAEIPVDRFRRIFAESESLKEQVKGLIAK